MEGFYQCQKGQTRLIMAGRQKATYPGAQPNRVKTYAEILSARFQKTSTKKAAEPEPPQKQVGMQRPNTNSTPKVEPHEQIK